MSDRMVKGVALKWMIPLLLAVVGVLQGAFILVNNYREERQHLVTGGAGDLSRSLLWMRGVIEHFQQEGDLYEVRKLVRDVATDDAILLLVVVDDSSQIQVSIHQEDEAEPLSEAVAEIGRLTAGDAQRILSTVQQVQQTLHPQILFQQDSAVLFAVSPLQLTPDSNAHSHVGALVAVRDLSRALNGSWIEAVRNSAWILIITLVAAVAIGVVLHRVLTRRIYWLMDVVERFGAGDHSVRTGVKGDDEFGRLCQTLDAVADEIDKNDKVIAQINTNLEIQIQQRTELLMAEKQAAEHASAVKTRFLSNTSHELRTPLNAIVGFGQLLKMDAGQFNADHQEYIHEILKAGHHLQYLVNEILDLAQIESGSLRIELHPVQCGGVVNEVIGMMDALIAQRAITLQLAQGTWLTAPVLADPVRLKQVLLNLLSNAIKYNHDGGRIEIGGQIRDGRVVISVFNTGPGIAPAQLNQLFMLFERAGADPRTEGAGVGLALTRELVHKMHGEIHVTSEVGRSATFTVILELADQALPDGKVH